MDKMTGAYNHALIQNIFSGGGMGIQFQTRGGPTKF